MLKHMTTQTQTKTPGLNLMLVGLLLAVIAVIFMAAGATATLFNVIGVLGVVLAVAGAVQWARARR